VGERGDRAGGVMRALFAKIRAALRPRKQLEVRCAELEAQVRDLVFVRQELERDIRAEVARVRARNDRIDELTQALEVVKTDRDAVLRREANAEHRGAQGLAREADLRARIAELERQLKKAES
jgi:chromosome segregation ATPase